MSRYTGPITRINRRFGCAVFPANKSFEKRSYLPGQHGQRLRRKVTPFSLGLIEKQKMRYHYGLTEKQFRLLFLNVKTQQGITGDLLLQCLETRLDSVVYSLGFAKTRRAARQFVSHGHIHVNGRRVDIASYQVSPGDEVVVADQSASRQLATRALEVSQYRDLPQWLSVDSDALRGFVIRVPSRAEINAIANEQAIVEFYSR